MNAFWKILFFFLVIISAYLGWEMKSRRDRRVIDMVTLSESVNPRDVTAMTERNRTEPGFIAALLLMHKYSSEKITTDTDNNQISGMRQFTTAAVDKLSVPVDERTLVQEALINAYDALDEAGVTEDNAAMAGMTEGMWPIIQKGPFKGEKLRLGWRVTPVLAPQLNAHPGNFMLQPECLWQMQDDRINNEMFNLARRFKNAGILGGEAWGRIEDMNKMLAGKL